MIGLSLSHRVYQHQVQEPSTASMFPAVDELLEITDVQKALKFVAGRKDMDRYRSMVDFLFAELVGGKWKAACFRFYEGEGPALKDDPRVTIEMLAKWEYQLVVALNIAEEMHLMELKTSWGWFHKQWLNAA